MNAKDVVYVVLVYEAYTHVHVAGAFTNMSAAESAANDGLGRIKKYGTDGNWAEIYSCEIDNPSHEFVQCTWYCGYEF